MEYLRVPVTDEKAPKERDLAELQARNCFVRVKGFWCLHVCVTRRQMSTTRP